MNLKFVKKELEASYNFFRNYSNLDINSAGYGLVVDRSSDLNTCSIAAVGFSFSAHVVGVENGWISRSECLDHIHRTLRTLLYNVAHYKGMFCHFIDMDTAKVVGKSEYSTIDTGLLLNGVITVESYFQDEKISILAEKLICRVDWDHFSFKNGMYTQFKMAYNPDKQGAYVTNNEEGFIHQWNMYAEQLMMYMQATHDPKISQEKLLDLYDGFERTSGSYKSENFVFAPGNALFIHQFSHAWFKFQDYEDRFGFDWYKNSVVATNSHIEFCNDCKFTTLSKEIFGLSAGDGPQGYMVVGAKPFNTKGDTSFMIGDGTVQQYAMASSINFAPELAIRAIDNLYQNHALSYGEFGFFDGMNLEKNWYSDEYLGIDKGITVLMLDNYLKGTTWQYYMKSKYTKKAIKMLKFRGKNGQES